MKINIIKLIMFLCYIETIILIEPKTKEIYLIKQGKSDSTKKKLSIKDFPLTEEGKYRVLTTSRDLKDEEIGNIYYSNTLASKETAKILISINNNKEIEMKEEPLFEFIEIDEDLKLNKEEYYNKVKKNLEKFFKNFWDSNEKVCTIIVDGNYIDSIELFIRKISISKLSKMKPAAYGKIKMNDIDKFEITYWNKHKRDTKYCSYIHDVEKLKNNEYPYILVEFRVFKPTQFGEEIYIIGDNDDFGNNKKLNFKLEWTDGHIWKSGYKINNLNKNINFKFTLASQQNYIIENGPFRTLSPMNLKGLEQNEKGIYILNFNWNCFKIKFNLHYLLKEENYQMEIIGNLIGNNKVPQPMKFQKDKKIIMKDGNEIKSFWSIELNFENPLNDTLILEYHYLIRDPKGIEKLIVERKMNRIIKISFTEEAYKNNPDSLLIYNSFLEITDIDFVADFKINKIGNKNIFIGPFPIMADDFMTLKSEGIDTIINVQSEDEATKNLINNDIHTKIAEENGIQLIWLPINKFDKNDLKNKLLEIASVLNELLIKNKKVYIHSVSSVTRAPAVIIIYLIIYKNYKLQQAIDYCRNYYNQISPNFLVLYELVKKYSPGSEINK